MWWWIASDAHEGPRPHRAIQRALRYLAVLPIVALTTGVAEIFYRLTGSDRLSAIFLAGVLLSAFLLGSGPAYAAAGLAFVVYFYWVDPRFSFTFGSPEDFNILMVFLAVSTLTGLLTGRVRDEARRAQARQRVNTAILAATREFSASSDEVFIRQRLVHHISVAARGAAVVLASDGAVLGSSEGQDGHLPVSAADIRSGGWRTRILRVDGNDFGVAAWRPAAAPLSVEEITLVEILADTGAAALSRARLSAGKADAEARARTEDLRNALLSSISHDLRTPLAAILASSSSLRDFGAAFDPATRDDLLDTIREEAERLDGVVANLLSMSRLEAGALHLQPVPFNVPEVVRRTVERRHRAGRAEILVQVASDTPEALGDAVLFEQALGNVIDNALRYGEATAPIGVLVNRDDDDVVVEVWDEGPGVPDADCERIFDKFYRAPSTAKAPGTGLGLAITRGFLSAMGGRVSVRNRADRVSGLTVTLRLKAAA